MNPPFRQPGNLFFSKNSLHKLLVNSLKIKLAEENDQERWDEYVNRHPDSSPYHLFAWQKAVKQAYGFRSYSLLAQDGVNVTGILPLIFLKTPFLQRALVALPYCDVGGALADTEKVEEGLLREAVDLAQEVKANAIDLRGEISNKTLEQLDCPVSETSHDKIRMKLVLPGSSEKLWSSFKSKLRSQVRKAEKNGLVFSWGGEKNIDEFYSVVCENMHDLGSPVHSKKWFQSVLKNFGASARMGIVRKNETAIGAGLILSVGSKICIPWASTLRRYNKLSPNMLLYWKLLEFAAETGCASFDFGRSTLGEGTYKFKAQWGAQPEPLVWYILSNERRENITSSSKSSSKREMVEKLWRILPLQVTNLLGPVVRKHISL